MTKTRQIPIANPRIYRLGRFDNRNCTWWAGSGIIIHAEGLHSLQLQCGPHTMADALLAVSVNYADYYMVKVKEGLVDLRLPRITTATSVVRVKSVYWEWPNVQMEGLVVNEDAKLMHYRPSKLVFQFIGDSLTAGVRTPKWAADAWTMLTAEAFKAECKLNPMPGGPLTDIKLHFAARGMVFQYFQTEDERFPMVKGLHHTTPWDFSKDLAPTHIFINIGSNDHLHKVSQDDYVQSYTQFLEHLRQVHPEAPIYLMRLWGRPIAEGRVTEMYPGAQEQVIATRAAAGDTNVYYIDTTGWISVDMVFSPGDLHPNVAGHKKMAETFSQWLTQNGIVPEAEWATPIS